MIHNRVVIKSTGFYNFITLFLQNISKVGDYMTVQEAKDMYLAAKAAYTAACSAQEYSISGRSKRNAEVDKLRKEMEYWDNKVADLEALAVGKGRRKAFRITPRDL